MTGTAGDPDAPLLRASGLRKAYGGAVALADGNLTVRAGEIHALLGENGAGKSTLIRSLAGTPPPDAGEIVVAGRALPRGHGSADAAASGLAFIHQEGSLVEDLSVEENIALEDGYPRRFDLIDWSAVRRFAREALERLGVELDPDHRVAELPLASQTVVAIARALARSARVVVLDEPTASLGAKDVQALFSVLRRIARAGTGIVFVSHRLDEVYELCNRITVLRDGVTVGTTRPDDISRPDLITMICGHPVVLARGRERPALAKPRVAARGLAGDMVGPVSFTVAPGEIVGFTGLSDAGHYEVGEILFGLHPVSAGELRLDGETFAPSGPAEAMARGIGYIPPDRNRDGLARTMTLAENLFFNPRRGSPGVTQAGILSGERERVAAEAILRRFSVRPPMPEARIVSLSGGNAQKVLVARWLREPPSLLIVNDVSVGVDIGAREEIYAVIREAAAAGSAVMVITSDFEEIETLCDRALVFVRGVHKAELRGAEVTVQAISGCLAGGTKPETTHAAGGDLAR